MPRTLMQLHYWKTVPIQPWYFKEVEDNTSGESQIWQKMGEVTAGVYPHTDTEMQDAILALLMEVTCCWRIITGHPENTAFCMYNDGGVLHVHKRMQTNKRVSRTVFSAL